MPKKIKFKDRARRTEMKKRNKVSSSLRKRVGVGRREFNKYDALDNGSRPMEELMSDIHEGAAVALYDESLNDPRALTNMLLGQSLASAKSSSSTTNTSKEKTTEVTEADQPKGKGSKSGGKNVSSFPLSLTATKETLSIAERLAAIEEEERRRREEELAAQNNTVNKNRYKHHGQNYLFWERVGLHPRLLKALRALHFTHPTPVQEEVLPNVLLSATENMDKNAKGKKNSKKGAGEKDVVVSAETGSGKTLVFALPILQDLLESLYGKETEDAKANTDKESGKKRTRDAAEPTEKPTLLSKDQFDQRMMHTLIVSPTRELALQINTAFKQLTQFAPDVSVGCIVGGMAAEKQQRILNRHPHILICTPGRLWDLSQKNEGCYLGHSISRRLKFVILDEGDKMLQSGKFEELKQLLERIHSEVLPAGFVQDREEGAEAGEMPVAEGRWDAEKQKFVPFTEEELKARKEKSKIMQGKSNKSKEENSDDEENEEEEELEEEEDEDENNEDSEDEEDEDVDKEKSKLRKDVPHVIPMPPEPPADHRVITYVTSATLSLQTNYERKDYKSNKSIIRTSNADVMGRVLQQLEIKPTNASIFTLSPQSGVVAKINETYLRCPDKSKDLYLYYFLKIFKDDRAVIFVNAISMLRRLVKLIGILGISVVGLHASMQQRQRLKFMDRFKSGDIRVLIATDVASRGLDIEGLKYVLHYQVPRSTDAYIHRCGRTARCGGTGLSLLLVSPQEHVSFKKLMESLGRKESEMETFSLQPTIVHQLHEHLRIALQIDKLQKEIDKSRAKNGWVSRMSKTADLEVDDMFDKEAESENREKEKAIRMLEKQLKLLVQKYSGSYGGKGSFRTGAQALGAKMAEEKLRVRAERQTVNLTGNSQSSSDKLTNSAQFNFPGSSMAKEKKKEGNYVKKQGVSVFDIVMGEKTEKAESNSKTSSKPKRKKIKFDLSKDSTAAK